MKKLRSTSMDLGDGVISTITTSEEVPQDVLDAMYSFGFALAPKLYQLAMKHLNEFTPDEQEYIKAVVDSLEEDPDE